MKIQLIPTARQIADFDLSNKTAVVIDVLRATSVIITALQNGAKAIVPVVSVEKAVELYKASGHTAVMGGEKDSIIIDGFQLGNSPLQYTSETISSKEVILKTTNGTEAINASSGANKLVAAAFLNLQAVVDFLTHEKHDVVVVCSGTNGKFSMDDGLCAGMIIKRLMEKVTAECCDLGLSMQQLAKQKGDLSQKLAHCFHLNYLLALGYEKDVDYCLQTDIIHLVPQWVGGKIIA
jgi:2-phosphosulfolactate phosphatase